jgi:hypothetical protein
MAMEMLLRRMQADAFTVHGFRSSFKTWAVEMTAFPNELSEAALAHVTGDRVEQAYKRTDVLERRRELMQRWAQFLESETSGVVVPLQAAATRSRDELSNSSPSFGAAGICRPVSRSGAGVTRARGGSKLACAWR